MTVLSPPLPRSCYQPSARRVAPRLLGQLLVFETPNGPVGGVIVEAEAYLHDDPACHASRGLTPRNAPMFGPPGYAYVYFTYGNHFCFNVVCAPEGVAEAVLIRSLHPSQGLDAMRARRRRDDPRHLCSGPGKLCQALGIGRDQNRLDLCGSSPLTIRRGDPVPRARIVRTTRIGIRQGAELALRFYVRGSEFISRK